MEQIDRQLKLIFATQSGTDLGTSWMEGYQASQKDVIDPDYYNPYLKGTKEYQYWLEGYDAGLMKEPSPFTNHSVSNDVRHNKPKNNKLFIKTVLAVTIIFAGFFIYDMAS